MAVGTLDADAHRPAACPAQCRVHPGAARRGQGRDRWTHWESVGGSRRGLGGAWGAGWTKAVSRPLLPSPASSATSASARTGSWSRWTSGPGSPGGAARMTTAPGTSPTCRWARPRAGHPLCPQTPSCQAAGLPRMWVLQLGVLALLGGLSQGLRVHPGAQGHRPDPARSQLCSGSRICGMEGR